MTTSFEVDLRMSKAFFLLLIVAGVALATFGSGGC